MKNIIVNNVGVWLAATIVAFLTIFSDKILERIRFRLNRADLRTKYFEELATDLSTYLFYSEIFHERYQKDWANDPEDLAAIGGAINGAITTLRKKEYVYRAWVRKYWGSTAVKQFGEVMAAVKSVDDAIHAFNDAGKEEEKTIELGKRLDTLRAKIDQWLVHYSRNQSFELPPVVAVAQSAVHPRAQRNAFRRRDARLQSRSFARWNQSPRRSPNSDLRQFCRRVLRSTADHAANPQWQLATADEC